MCFLVLPNLSVICAQVFWNRWHDFSSTAAWTPWQTIVESTSSRRADTRTGAGLKDRDSLIVAGSYHQQAGGIVDADAARRFAEGGFTAISISAANETSVAAALNWGAAYGFSVFVADSNASDLVDTWGCHTSLGGAYLSGSDEQLSTTVRQLKLRGPWL
eukprot:COSAG04_NODE_3157_length_3106_cov_1.804789_3_plen_159_part_01